MKSMLRNAYSRFKAGEHDAALHILRPVTDGASGPEDALQFFALLWGVAADTYWEMGRTEDSLRAYRRCLEIDPVSGAVNVYAKHVVDNSLNADAEHALRCVLRARELDRKSWIGLPLAFILSLVLAPRSWWFMFIEVPRLPKRLARLADQQPI